MVTFDSTNNDVSPQGLTWVTHTITVDAAVWAAHPEVAAAQQALTDAQEQLQEGKTGAPS